VLSATPKIDYVVVRENVEGMFASSRHGGARVENQVVTDTMIITRAGTERVVRYAFELARTRHKAHPARPAKVMCVDKSNAFASYAFFRAVFDDVAAQYPDVRAEYGYIDAFTTYQVLRPETLDVAVMENLFGDITSDLAGATVGGLGLAASGDIGLEHAVFQSAHGSAPDIAGLGIANPTAAIYSAALMLDWLGSQHNDLAVTEAAAKVVAGIETALADPAARTKDLGGTATTIQAGDAIVAAIENPTGDNK
jgi:3-isopropylmalate dehydrogenase